jgi:nucleoid-associated protein YgaU
LPPIGGGLSGARPPISPAANSASLPAASDPWDRRSAPVSNAGVGTRTYTVRDGDTIYSIARYQLGRAEHWVSIYDLNQATLGRQFSRPAAGTQLVLPDEAALARRPGQMQN